MFKKRLKSSLIACLQNIFILLAPKQPLAPPEGPVLVIAPHPDDETLGCGATILWLRSLGTRVRIVIVTDGSACAIKSCLSPNKLAQIRQVEALKAIKTLGVPETDIVFLSHKDGCASQALDSIARDLSAQIWLSSPAWILFPYEIDGHEDHRAVAKAVQNLQKEGKITGRLLAYPIWFWPRGAIKHLFDPRRRKTHLKVEAAPFLDKKKEALSAYSSQFENITGEKTYSHLDPDFLRQHLRSHELFFDISLTNKA